MALIFIASAPAQAQLETLIMPGELTEAHAELEKECGNCHLRFERKQQRALCLDCHDEIAADIESKSGFHGMDRRAKRSTCANCHTDHEGRDADIIGLDENRFDHDLTRFPLLGGHADQQCGDCHAPDVRRRDTPSNCFSCHEGDDAHAGTLGTQCGDCHTPEGWLNVEFDHDTTGFSLIGNHQGPGCLDCHADDTFQDTPTTCYSCHAEDDAHDGRSGTECGNCHSPVGWHETSFNHERDTQFSLDGMHAEQACDSCHSADPFSDSLSTTCVSCHEDDDNHDRHFGGTCDTCHATSGWPDVHFDHDVDTGHALLGAHADAECTACHIEPIFDASPGTNCLACHEDDDAHSSSMGMRCTDCHTELSWQDDVFFDHGLTRFPLLGNHVDLECDSCHESHVFRDAPEMCVDCHREDDAHDGRFGEKCAFCHNPVAWPQWMFDHDVQTGFTLDGAHENVACENCHRSTLTMQMSLGQYCSDCHRSDDIHDGEFGPDCARCHTSDSFRDVRTIR